MTTTLQHRGTATQAPSLNSGWTQLEFSQSAPPVLPLVMAKRKQNLAVDTPRGKQSEVWQKEALDGFCCHHKSLDYITTSGAAIVDGLCYMNREKSLYALIEVRSRPHLTKKKLADEYEWSGMISADKIERGKLMSSMLVCPFVFFMYLRAEKLVLVKQISDKYGDLTAKMDIRESLSQETINGGKTMRMNAFVEMEDAEEYKI